MAIRRVRGTLLRAALRRSTAILIGAVLLIPAAAVTLLDFDWETWVTDGLSLIAGGTGAALVLTGLAGRRPDWVDPN